MAVGSSEWFKIIVNLMGTAPVPSTLSSNYFRNPPINKNRVIPEIPSLCGVVVALLSTIGAFLDEITRSIGVKVPCKF
jgi:hypothetical protein